MSGRIDDPVDASFEAWPENHESPGEAYGELALKFSALVFTPARVLNILKDRFFPSSRVARVVYLLDGMRLKLDRLESETRSKFAVSETGLHEAMKKLQLEIEGPAFEAAVAIACEEAARAIDLGKVEQFSSILVGALAPDPWFGLEEDIARMIRDIAQLGEIDIFVLRELETTFQGAGGPNHNLVNDYTERMPQLRQTIARSKLHPDDFYAVCSRLAGFGFALQEERNNSRTDLPERCFRPTHRGKTLLSYLKSVDKTSQQKGHAAG